MAASRIPNPLGQGSSPWGYASFRMLTANLYTELLIQLVKIHPVYLIIARINIDMSQNFKKLKFNKEFLLDETSIRNVKALTSLNTTNVLTKDLIDLINNMGIIPTSCIVVPYTAALQSTIIHIDDFDVYDQVNLNFVIDDGLAYANWYEKNKDYNPYIRVNAVGGQTYSYSRSNMTLLEADHISGACLFQSGVPHNVSNILRNRWCVSVKLRQPGGKTVHWDQAITMFENYFIQ